VRVAVLGDLHGNAAALKAVLTAARKEAVARLLITGDFVGYYYSPNDVLEMLSEWQTEAVRGNHEDMLCEVGQDVARLAALTKKYGSGLSVALASLTAAQQSYLCSLPQTRCVELEGRRILLAHGSPWSTDLYVYPDASPDVLEDIASSARRVDATMVCLGHTHYRMIKRIGDILILNPGSVGQPRDGNLGACWALVDLKSLEIELRVEAYDIDQVAGLAKLKDPDQPYLHNILYRR
jgi:putative phosphoesterase